MKNFSIAGFVAIGLSILILGCQTKTFEPKDVNSASIAKYESFYPAQVWLDNNGRHINAHGAGAIFADGRYYIFGEHKLGGTLGNKSVVGVHCYSSVDLYNWLDEGIALPMSDNPNSEILRGTILERPKVIFNQRTKKYVMWMHLEFRKGSTSKSTDLKDIYAEKPDYSTARAGVAVADNIVGPYKFLGSFRLNAGKYPIGEEESLKAYRAQLDKNPIWKTEKLKGTALDEAVVKGRIFLRDFEQGQMARDMTVFKDDDQKAYLVCASEDNKTLQIHELSADYTSLSGKFVRTLRNLNHEAPAIFKKDGKYFMFSSHCTGWAPNAGRLSVADNILGQWREIGNPCRGTGSPQSKTQLAANSQTTFRSQSSAVIPLENKKDAFIYFGDRWTPSDAIDGRYVVLPVEWENGLPIIKWYDNWNLSIF